MKKPLHKLTPEEMADIKASLPSDREAVRYWLLTGTDDIIAKLPENFSQSLIDEVRAEIDAEMDRFDSEGKPSQNTLYDKFLARLEEIRECEWNDNSIMIWEEVYGRQKGVREGESTLQAIARNMVEVLNESEMQQAFDEAIIADLKTFQKNLLCRPDGGRDGSGYMM